MAQPLRTVAENAARIRAKWPTETANMSDAEAVRYYVSQLDESTLPQADIARRRASMISGTKNETGAGSVFVKSAINSALMGLPQLMDDHVINPSEKYFSDAELREHPWAKTTGDIVGMFAPGGLVKGATKLALRGVGTTMKLPQAAEALTGLAKKGESLSALQKAVVGAQKASKPFGGPTALGMALAQPTTNISMEEARQQAQDASLDPNAGPPQDTSGRSTGKYLAGLSGLLWALPGAEFGRAAAMAAPIAGAATGVAARSTADANPDTFQEMTDSPIQNILLPIGFGALGMRQAKKLQAPWFGRPPQGGAPAKKLGALDQKLADEAAAAQAALGGTSSTATTATAATGALPPAGTPATATPAAAPAQAAPAAAAAQAAPAGPPPSSGPVQINLARAHAAFGDGMVGLLQNETQDRQAGLTLQQLVDDAAGAPKIEWTYSPSGIPGEQYTIGSFGRGGARIIANPKHAEMGQQPTLVRDKISEKSAVHFANPWAGARPENATTTGTITLTGPDLVKLAQGSISHSGWKPIGDDLAVIGANGEEALSLARDGSTWKWITMNDVPPESPAARALRAFLDVQSAKKELVDVLDTMRSPELLAQLGMSADAYRQAALQKMGKIIAIFKASGAKDDLVHLNTLLKFAGEQAQVTPREAQAVMQIAERELGAAPAVAPPTAPPTAGAPPAAVPPTAPPVAAPPAAAAPAAPTAGTPAPPAAPRSKPATPPQAPWPEDAIPEKTGLVIGKDGKAIRVQGTGTKTITPYDKSLEIGDGYYWDPVNRLALPMPGVQKSQAAYEMKQRMVAMAVKQGTLTLPELPAKGAAKPPSPPPAAAAAAVEPTPPKPSTPPSSEAVTLRQFQEGNPGGNGEIPLTVTDGQRKALADLGYAPADVEKLTPVMASDIIRNNKRAPAVAAPQAPQTLTPEQRSALVQLGYTPKDLQLFEADKRGPGIVQSVLTKGLARPNGDRETVTWYEAVGLKPDKAMLDRIAAEDADIAARKAARNAKARERRAAKKATKTQASASVEDDAAVREAQTEGRDVEGGTDADWSAYEVLKRDSQRGLSWIKLSGLKQNLGELDEDFVARVAKRIIAKNKPTKEQLEDLQSGLKAWVQFNEVPF